MKYDFEAGGLVRIPPDEAAGYGEKVRLCDMKKSLYRVMASFNKPKVKRARKESNKEQDS